MTDKKTEPFWHRPESRRLEFKETLPRGEALAKTAIAFANGAGGKLVFGVKDMPRTITGILDEDLFALEEKISNQIFDLCTPAIIPEIYIQSTHDKHLLVVEIFPGSQKPYFLKNKGKHNGTYIRVGSSNRKASAEMLEELERQKRKISFDSMTVYEAFDADQDLKTFVETFKKRTGLDMDHAHLKNMGLITCEREKTFPVNAAVLLSDSPLKHRLFPYAKIECARFKGNTPQVFLDQATFDGPVFTSSDLCLEFIKRNVSLSSVVQDVYREDTWEYPLPAIREAVNNAIIHRDYSLLGSDIKVAIFDDMLEITSPGPLPDTMPIEKLGSGRSEIRNRILAPVFKKLKLIEAWGTGIQRMRHELRDYPHIELEFKETDFAFQVCFWKVPETGQGKSQKKIQEATGEATGEAKKINQVMGFCKEPKSASEIMQFLGLKHREHFRLDILQPMMEKGILKQTLPHKPRSPKQKYYSNTQ